MSEQKRFCQHCGAKINPDNALFCQNCGTAVNAPMRAIPPPMRPMTLEEQDVKDNKAMAIMSYLGILFLVPLFAAKKSPFARFHCNNGLVLFIAHLSVAILTSLVSSFINPISLLLAGFLTFVLFGISVFLFVVSIMGLVHAIKGEKKELPIIGKIKILK